MEQLPSWPRPALVILNLLWIGCLLLLAHQWLSFGFEAWAEGYAGSHQRMDRIHDRSRDIEMWIGMVTLAGPVVIAIVAAVGRRFATAVVYGFLAALACLPVVIVVHRARPPEPRPSPRYVCQEHSGPGGVTCPGGWLSRGEFLIG